jgi:hypothetical protein
MKMLPTVKQKWVFRVLEEYRRLFVIENVFANIYGRDYRLFIGFMRALVSVIDKDTEDPSQVASAEQKLEELSAAVDIYFNKYQLKHPELIEMHDSIVKDSPEIVAVNKKDPFEPAGISLIIEAHGEFIFEFFDCYSMCQEVLNKQPTLLLTEFNNYLSHLVFCFDNGINKCGENEGLGHLIRGTLDGYKMVQHKFKEQLSCNEDVMRIYTELRIRESYGIGCDKESKLSVICKYKDLANTLVELDFHANAT